MPLDASLDPLFEAAGKQYNVDPALLKAQALAESGGRLNAVSPQGAQGLMQLMPETARGLGVTDPFDPSQAIPGAARYLSQGLDKYGDPVKALMFYHGGPDEGIWGPKTQAYPHAVASFYGQARPISVQPLSSEAAPQGYAHTLEEQLGGQWTPISRQNPQSRFIPSGKPMNGIEQLAAAGQPQGTQLAQAPGMSDEELLKGFVDWSHPFLPQPSKAAQPAAQPQPQALPAAPAQPGGQAVLGPEQVINMLNTAGQAKGGIAAIPGLMSGLEKMLSEGTQFVRQPDGSIGMGTIGGATGAMKDIGAAKSEGTEGPKRVSEAVKPQKMGPGETMYLPPGSPNAGVSGAAQPPGPLSAVPAPGGGSAVTGAPPTATTEQFNKSLTELGAEANTARAALYEANLLKSKIHEIGTSGPLTESLGRLSAFAQQMGVSPETLKKYNLPNGATVEQANALALGLLGDVLKTQFPQRITNTDIAVFKPSSANPNMLEDAVGFLVDKRLAPKLQRSVDRYGAAVNADLPQQTPVHLQRFLNEWDNQHPFESFAASSRALDDATRSSAETAISKGAARDAVIKRLRDNGYDVTGFGGQK